MKVRSPAELAILRMAIAASLSILALAPAGAAYAQQDFRIGSFHVEQRIDPITDEDRSIAFLVPNGEPGAGGMVAWACGGADAGLLAGVSLAGVSRDGSPRAVVWRFDRDRPDSTYLMGFAGGETWSFRGQDLVDFTIRAKTASRLVIRDLGEAPGLRSTDYIYDLTGSTSALNRLSCARNPRILGTPVHETAPVVQGDSTVLPDTERTYELSAVEELPRPTNSSEFQRSVARNYPPLLRDAGLTGTVHARFRVLETGAVDANSIAITQTTHEQFNDAARRALLTLVFRPARVNGRPVRVWVEQPVQFTPPE